jgi:hypothetical protein
MFSAGHARRRATLCIQMSTTHVYRRRHYPPKIRDIVWVSDLNTWFHGYVCMHHLSTRRVIPVESVRRRGTASVGETKNQDT